MAASINDNAGRRSSLRSAIATAIAVSTLFARVETLALATSPGGNVIALAASVPADLPLAASAPNRAEWLREANVLQPYGHSEFVAIAEAASRAARLKKEFGFNAIVVQPPDSHNTIAAAADKLTEDQFRTGLAAYRSAGYHIVLYTSVMALGLSPEFQSGAIAREHPDWLQRDPKGNTVKVWGVPWLCPSSAARELALDRCQRIVHDYHPDGILLDNNEFFFADAGWTCHCDACQKAFREYIQKRFGSDRSSQLFGLAPSQVKIPTDEGPLYFEWLHWRNRVWAEINESFRARLRVANPEIALFANTQYGYDNGMLGTDQQYAREDVILSESCNLSSRQMSEKMVLGKALAAGRPVWNYIGTFAKADDYTGLLPPEIVGPAIAATIAHHARPWIVDGFDDGPTNANSRDLMSTLLSWQAAHPQFYNNERWAVVGSLMSLTSRNVRHTPLITPCMSALQSAGVPALVLRDEELALKQLRLLRVLIVENAACLPDKSAAAIADWVRAGGTLIATADVGAFDELGRNSSQPVLWKSLGLSAAPAQPTTIDRGTVTVPTANDFIPTVLRLVQPFSFSTDENAGMEVVPYVAENTLQLHIIRHQATDHPVTIRVPKLIAVSQSPAKLLVPGSDESNSIVVDSKPSGAQFTISHLPLYSVVEITLRQSE